MKLVYIFLEITLPLRIPEGQPRNEDRENVIELLTAMGLEEQGLEEETVNEALIIQEYVAKCYEDRQLRQEMLNRTFKEITIIVDRFKSANYDLGMVAGRQMSTTSGEFIVQNIERDILGYIDKQIAILPDPDLKKKKAKPEEVTMIKELLEEFLEENMDLIIPEVEEVEEEEKPIPVVTIVYAVPGIGPPVDDEVRKDFDNYAIEVSMVQANVFMPRNIRHFLCPPLEKYIDPDYDDKKEDVPTGGAAIE